MSTNQQVLSGFFESEYYRTIVKDAYSTRNDGRGGTYDGQAQLEVMAWKVADHEGDLQLKDDAGNLIYPRILDLALGEIDHPGADPVGAEELARRTALKSYADDQGGRSASTIRGYVRNADRLSRLPSSHPIKRVLRRWARSQDLGHFEDGKATRKRPGDAEPIDLGTVVSAYKLARMIASQEGFVFVPQDGNPVAVEDNERIDKDEIRKEDRPIGEMKAAVQLTKPNGKTYEYAVDFDEKKLIRHDGTDMPPVGWSA